MLQETNLEKALKQVQQGKRVLAATKKDNGRYMFRPLTEILDKYVFLIDVAAVENPEFKETIEEMKQSIPHPKEDNEKKTHDVEKGYTGFLHIKCKCGEERSFCARSEMNFCKCDKCGEETELKDLKLAFANCECGQCSRYFTNETAEMFDLNCVRCGGPVALKYNKKKNLYETIKG